MLAERYLRKRYEEGYKAGVELARRLDKERRRRYKARVYAWKERRLTAQTEDKFFDEPMPRFGYEGVVLWDILTEDERRAKLRPNGSIGVWIRVARMICRSFRR